MSKVVFTFPGKLGDFFHQWPIAYHYGKMFGDFHVGLDQRLLKPIAGLVARQPHVEHVWLLPGIEHYQIGGQPFDFGMPYQEYKHWDKVYHLGFRDAPEKPITLQCREYVDFKIPTKALKRECTLVGEREPRPRNLLLLHGRRYDMYGEFPNFWHALWESWDLLKAEFDEIEWIGLPEEKRISDKFGGTDFDDGGDWVKLVDEMRDARLVMGVGGAMVALAGALKVPSIRIHDPVLGFREEVFANFGERQWNLGTDADYRKEIEKCVASVNSLTNSLSPT